MDKQTKEELARQAALIWLKMNAKDGELEEGLEDKSLEYLGFRCMLLETLRLGWRAVESHRKMRESDSRMKAKGITFPMFYKPSKKLMLESCAMIDKIVSEHGDCGIANLKEKRDELEKALLEELERWENLGS